MTIPTFVLKGSALDLLDTDDPTALDSITLTPNTRGQMVSIAGVLYRPEPITITLDEDGTINGDVGVTLLANDPTLELESPLQWHVQLATSEGFPRQPKPFWFEAPEDGDVVQLGDVSVVPLLTPQGLTRGPKGDTGAQGTQGIQGVPGVQGERGEVGPTGPAGTTSWLGLTDKPTVIAAGPTAADARNAIGAGTSSVQIGTTSTTAKRGDYTPTGSEITAALGYTPLDASTRAQANGVASLDGSGLVPSAQLPGFVDDVIEVSDFAALPGTGSAGKLYVALDSNKVFRWSGSVYVEVSGSPGSTDAVAEGSTNLYFTTTRAQNALTSQLAGKADSSHTHSQSDVTGLTTSLSGKSDVGHTHSQSDVTGLADSLAGKAASAHTHSQSDVTGLATALSGKEPTITAGTTGKYLRGDKSWQTLDKAAVGLSNVENTSDANKPVSTATQTALNAKLTVGAATAPSTVGPTYYAPGYVANSWYFMHHSTSNSSSTMGQDGLRTHVFSVTAAVTVTRLAVELTAAGSANGYLRLGIWNHNPATGKPGTLVVEADTLSTGTGSAGTVAYVSAPRIYEVPIAGGTGVALNPGMYWIGYVVHNSSSAPSFRTGVPLYQQFPLGANISDVTGNLLAPMQNMSAYWPTGLGALSSTPNVVPNFDTPFIRILFKVAA